MSKLFRDEADVKQLIKLRTIYELLETDQRPLRGCRQHHRRHRARKLVWTWTSISISSGGRHRAGRRRARVRLHERLPRRGELHRHRGLDARAQALSGRAHGGVLQLPGHLHLPSERGGHDRQGHRRPGIIDHYVVFGALIGAIAWNMLTWYYGIPSSSSHALIGGLVGAGVAKAGTCALSRRASSRRSLSSSSRR